MAAGGGGGGKPAAGSDKPAAGGAAGEGGATAAGGAPGGTERRSAGRVAILAADLAKWDETSRDTLVLPVFRDERPLRGAAGLVDWRLCGRLSRLIKKGKVSGERGETLMMPPGRRLRFGRLMIFGLGESNDYGEARFREDVRWIRKVADDAGVTEYAVEPPGRATGLIGARRALELWLDEAGKDGLEPRAVTLVDSPNGHKDMADLLRQRRD
ncbi:MAG: leucyl aminopeptidase [Kofleriaceae bacterium]|nr:leucyl aminopeptidase [Kofleriaceae bacterium]MCB9572557.1 leucyl aminopeptidase [Kofleriaceae bacterium]